VNKLRKYTTYIFYIPAVILLLVSEKVRGEKITWRVEETINAYLKASPRQTCIKCGHTGDLFLLKNDYTKQKNMQNESAVRQPEKSKESGRRT